jgi:dipeptidase E
MKLLLTDSGVTNPSIHAALVGLLGKPIAESSALCIPTAMYGHPMVGPGTRAWQFISGTSENPMVELGWKSVGVLELTALPSLARATWEADVREADVLLVNGGDGIYLDRWMRESGLAALVPSLGAVWVGLSSGSFVMSPRIADVFASWPSPIGGGGLGMVDFEIFPHLDNPDLPQNTMADAERWAAGLTRRGYAIDDETAISVVDGTERVVSEGHWRLFEP